ncbi:MAG: leucine-rich repeat domain-containing protein [Clostridia bacterium]|nr:leucine-rich repeat domain-containing protein [Clostridia bacterium]
MKKSKKKSFKPKKFLLAGLLTAGIACGAMGLVGCSSKSEKPSEPQDNKYQINFESSAEGFVAFDLEVKEGTKISDITNIPELTGFDFVGLFKDESCTNQYLPDDVIQSDSTIYVKYAVKTTVLKLYIDGQLQTTDSIDFFETVEQALTRLQMLEESNFKYIGWFTNAEMTQPVDLSTGATTEMILYTKSTNADKLSFEYQEGTDSYAVGGCVTANEVIIPEMFEGKPVTTIKDEAFSSSTITTLYIPKTISNIGVKVFTYGEIEDIDVDVENAVYKSLNGCVIEKSTDTLVLGSNISILPEVSKIGDYAFYNIKMGNLLKIAEKTTIIGESAFEKTNILNVTVSSTVEKISKLAFARTKILGITFAENSSLKEIGDNAFCGYEIEAKFNLPNTVTTLGSKIFETAYPREVVIPESVTTMAEDSLKGCYADKVIIKNKALSSIKIEYRISALDISANDNIRVEFFPFTVDSASEDSFYNLVGSLKNVVFPACLKTIKSNWSSTPSLETIKFEEGITTIAEQAIGRFPNLKSVELPESLIEIKSYAFCNCPKLSSIVIPKNVTTIGDSAFYQCSNLYEVYNLSSLPFALGEKSYGYITYYAYKIHTDASAPRVIKTIGDFVVMDDKENSRLISYLGTSAEPVLPENINGNDYAIGANLFKQNTTISKIIVPKAVKEIHASAFYHADNLATFELEENSRLAKIEKGAFMYCKLLTSFHIPVGVSEIGQTTFAHSGITNLTIDESNTTFYIENQCVINRNTKALICSSVSCTAIPSEVTEIGRSGFISNATSLVIPASVTKIEQGAFSDCLNLTSLTVAEGNTVYYDGGNCVIEKTTQTLIASASNCVIPDGVKIIGSEAFANTKITSITVPSSVETIADKAFYICLELTTVKLNNGLKTIGDFAFNYCQKLTSIEIPASVKTIGKSAFLGCNALESVTLHEGLETISDSAFSGCHKLESIIIPNTVTSVGGSAFFGFKALTSIKLSTSLTTIESYTIYGGSTNSLKTIIIPKNITQIKPNNFNTIEKLYYEGTKEEWASVQNSSNINTSKIYYYSEEYAQQSWHYDTDGITPVIWE